MHRTHLPVACAAITGILLTGGLNAPAAAQTATADNINFTVVAALPESLVTKYGGLAATEQLVTDQFAEINQNFNAQGAFSRTETFTISRFYTFTGDPTAEVCTAHPDEDLAIVYDESFDQGGWFQGCETILNDWPADQGGVFSQNSTDGNVHELGHSRGAIDVYGLQVDPSRNPINGQGYEPPPGIMTYPYGVHTWDMYSINVINQRGADLYDGSQAVWGHLPATVGVEVRGNDNQPLGNAQVRLYPVDWFSQTVTGVPLTSGKACGGIFDPPDPFQAGPTVSPSSPWYIGHPLFLVTAAVAGHVGYGWLSLIDAGNADYADPTAAYRVRVTIPGVHGAHGGRCRSRSTPS